MLLTAGVLMFSACDRFLDIRPVGKVIPETPAEYRALMTTAYQFQFIDRSLTDMRTDGLVVLLVAHEIGGVQRGGDLLLDLRLLLEIKNGIVSILAKNKFSD